MATYTYKCPECEKITEIQKPMLDPHPEVCPVCGKVGLVHMMHPPAVIYHGSGFYHTDKVIDEITDPEYQLTPKEQEEYYDEKLRHGDDRKIRVFT